MILDISLRKSICTMLSKIPENSKIQNVILIKILDIIRAKMSSYLVINLVFYITINLLYEKALSVLS